MERTFGNIVQIVNENSTVFVSKLKSTHMYLIKIINDFKCTYLRIYIVHIQSKT